MTDGNADDLLPEARVEPEPGRPVLAPVEQVDAVALGIREWKERAGDVRIGDLPALGTDGHLPGQHPGYEAVARDGDRRFAGQHDFEASLLRGGIASALDPEQDGELETLVGEAWIDLRIQLGQRLTCLRIAPHAERCAQGLITVSRDHVGIDADPGQEIRWSLAASKQESAKGTDLLLGDEAFFQPIASGSGLPRVVKFHPAEDFFRSIRTVAACRLVQDGDGRSR